MISQVTEILDNLRKIDGVKTALVVDRDGLLIAEGSEHETDSSEMLASLFARAIHSFERSTKTATKEASGIHQLIVEREGDEKLIMFVAIQFFLVVVTKGTVNIGLIRMEMREAINQLTPLLGS
jgi:uncharacterized protein